MILNKRKTRTFSVRVRVASEVERMVVPTPAFLPAPAVRYYTGSAGDPLCFSSGDRCRTGFLEAYPVSGFFEVSDLSTSQLPAS